MFDRICAANKSIRDASNTTVPITLTSGVMPRLIDEKMYTGSVVLGPATKNEMMKSSKLNVKLSRNAAKIAGDICGSVICMNVLSGGA